jgi:hypothetical protein
LKTSDEQLNEFDPDDGAGRPKYIPWVHFIEGVKGIVGKEFECVENVVKSTIKARFVPHDPMEFGPTMLYSYYETRAGGRNKGAISTRGSIQVGNYYPNTTGLGDRNFITQFDSLEGHEFEHHFDLTPKNISEIANIILSNTQGAYQMPQQTNEGDVVDFKSGKKVVPQQISMRQAFGGEEENALYAIGIKFAEKPSYPEDFEGRGPYREYKVDQVALKRAERAVGHRFSEYSTRNMYGSDPSSLQSSVKHMPDDEVFIIRFGNGDRYLVSQVGARTYIRNWAKIT